MAVLNCSTQPIGPCDLSCNQLTISIHIKLGKENEQRQFKAVIEVMRKKGVVSSGSKNWYLAVHINT